VHGQEGSDCDHAFGVGLTVSCYERYNAGGSGVVAAGAGGVHGCVVRPVWTPAGTVVR